MAVKMRTLACIPECSCSDDDPSEDPCADEERGSLGVAVQMRTLARIPGCGCADEDPSEDPWV